MSDVICSVCGFNGRSSRYHCHTCERRYLRAVITTDLLDRATEAVENAHDDDGIATMRGVATAVLLAVGFAGGGGEKAQ